MRNDHNDPTGGEVLARVRKLLDKAEGTSNSHESDAFSRKAAELIATHRIDPARLAAIDGSDELVVREFLLGRGAYVRARLALLQAISEANNVRVVFQSSPTGMTALAAGFRSDLDLVGIMYNSLHQQAASQMAGIRRATGAATQRFRRSFLFGFADRLGEMLAESQAAAEQASRPAGVSADRNAAVTLAVQSRVDRVEEFAASSFGRVRAARRPNAAQPGGWEAGASAAARADVGRARIAGRRAIGRGRR